MKHGKEAGILLLITGLIAGCSGEPSIHNKPNENAVLHFQRHPAHNFDAGSCESDPNSWVEFIYNNSLVGSTETIGVTEHSAGTTPDYVAGATIKSLGGLSFRIATSMDKSGSSAVIDLAQHPYSRVLSGEPGKYDVVLSGREGVLHTDHAAYFQVDCLPVWGYYGNHKPVPLQPEAPQQPENSGDAQRA